jgi:uncharacterized protein
MKSTRIAGDGGAVTRVVILDSGEEAFAALTKFANDAGITAASLTAIGAFERATVGWFDVDRKTYKEIEVSQQCEVLSAIGDVAAGDDGKASLHVHVVLGLSDGTTRGGHLLNGKVSQTHARGRSHGHPHSSETEEKAGHRHRADRSDGREALTG